MKNRPKIIAGKGILILNMLNRKTKGSIIIIGLILIMKKEKSEIQVILIKLYLFLNRKEVYRWCLREFKNSKNNKKKIVIILIKVHFRPY